jgi:HEPN domain-containing protein
MDASDEAGQLLKAAEKDLNALRGMIGQDAFADEIFGFHAQQATEKALKAWLALLGVEYPRTHDLSLLLSLLSSLGQDVELLEDLVEFNPYAVQYRYDAFEEMGSPLDRRAVIARVGELLSDIKTQIKRPA